MYRKFLLCILLVAFSLPMTAVADPSAVPDDKREQYKEKLRRYQHQFLTRELGLSREEANKFFPVYDSMCDELEQVGRDTRVLEQKTLNNTNASAVECENTARALFEQKKTESEIELRYFEQFRELLSPRQLLQLKSAEDAFRRDVLKHFARSRRENQEQR